MSSGRSLAATARFRGTGGLLLLSHHPWALVVLLGIIAAFVYLQNQRRR